MILRASRPFVHDTRGPSKLAEEYGSELDICNEAISNQLQALNEEIGAKIATSTAMRTSGYVNRRSTKVRMAAPVA